MIINVKIEVGKIPKEKIFKSDKTGRSYLDIKVAELRQPDQYENTHTVYIQKEKDDEKIYIGSGKAVYFGNDKKQPEKQQSQPQSNEGQDDLPF